MLRESVFSQHITNVGAFGWKRRSKNERFVYVDDMEKRIKRICLYFFGAESSSVIPIYKLHKRRKKKGILSDFELIRIYGSKSYERLDVSKSDF